MPRKVDIVAQVDEQGRLSKTRRQWLASQLRLYAGGDVRIQISRPKRSNKANAYLWGVIYPEIQRKAAEAGYAWSAEAIHEVMKRRYLEARILEVMGETHVLAGSSAELDSTAFYDFIESVKMDEDVIALGCYFPEPDSMLV